MSLKDWFGFFFAICFIISAIATFIYSPIATYFKTLVICIVSFIIMMFFMFDEEKKNG